MSTAPEPVRPRLWVVGPLVVLGLLMLVGMTASVIDWLRDDDTYQSSKFIAVDEPAFDSIMSIADSESFRRDVAAAADLDASEVEVVACRPVEAPYLQVSVRHRDRDATLNLVKVVVPTLNHQIEGGRSVLPPGAAVPDAVHEMGTASVELVDADDPPRCDFAIQE
jgi:hypothetical protein